MLYNRIFNSRPIVVHSPSGNPVWGQIKKQFFQSPEQHHTLDEVTILTWNSIPKESLFERSVRHLGLHCVVLGTGIEKWDNTMKIQLTNEALQTVKTSHVMGVDAFDAILIKNPKIAISRLEKSGYEMLFNATTGTFRSLPEHIIFFERIYMHEIYRHLNAGAWMGRTSCCLEFFKKAEENHRKFHRLLENYSGEEKLGKSEQVRIKHTFVDFYPRVGIDHHCRIFQLLNNPSFCPAELGEDQGVVLY